MFNFNSRSLNEDNNKKNFNEKNNPVSKNFEKALDILLKEKISLETCSEIIFKKDDLDHNINEKKPFKFLNPNFMASSNKNESLYLLFPRTGRDRKIVYQFFWLIEVSDKIEIKEFYLKFNSKNKKQTNKISEINSRNVNEKSFQEAEFIVSGLEIHHINQNQLCFYSKDKIAFIKDLNILKDLKNKEIIEINVNQELDFQIKNKFICYGKFKFSEFDDYFGLLSSDNNFNLYSIDNVLPEITFNFDLNIVDFEFGKASKTDILQPFNVYFLKENGEIISCSPIFPKSMNADSLSNLDDFIDLYDQKEASPICFENKVNFTFNDSTQNNFDNLKPDDTEDIVLKILKNLKKCLRCIKDEPKKPKFEQNKIIFNNKKTIEINDYLQSFNKNFCFQTINISEKNNNLLNESRNSRSLANSVFPEKAFFKKYTQLHVLPTLPVTFLRVFENNVIEIISLIDEIKPLISRNNINKKEENIINAVLTEIINFNHYPEMDLSEFKIKSNTCDPSQILINNIFDLYILKIKNELNNNNLNTIQVQYKKSELTKIIKIDYLKKNFLENKIFGYFGVDFLYSKGNNNQILSIKTDPEDKFTPYLFSTKANKDKEFLRNRTNKKEDLKNYRRIRHSFEKVLTNKNANEYFTKLEQIYKQL